MTDTVAAYRECRERLSDLVAPHVDTAASIRVPACPKWTVHDVIAHVSGACADILAGNLDGVASDAWTDAQVQARREVPTAALLADWAELGPKVEALFAPDSAGQLCFDVVTHEHDVRGALGEVGATDSVSTLVGFEFATGGFAATVSARGLPTLRIVAGDSEQVAGSSAPEGTLTASPYDLLRSCSGRRSADQIRALDWEGDPEVWLACFTWGPFVVPSVDVP